MSVYWSPILYWGLFVCLVNLVVIIFWWWTDLKSPVFLTSNSPDSYSVAFDFSHCVCHIVYFETYIYKYLCFLIKILFYLHYNHPLRHTIKGRKLYYKQIQWENKRCAHKDLPKILCLIFIYNSLTRLFLILKFSLLAFEIHQETWIYFFVLLLYCLCYDTVFHHLLLRFVDRWVIDHTLLFPISYLKIYF